MKIAREELANIIKEEVEKALNEQDFFEPEEEIEIKKTNPGGVDKDGVPLKAPFPPDAKNARELIKKYPPNSDERKDYRKWYNKYGPGAKSKKRKVQKAEFPAQTVARTTPEEFYDRAVKAEVKGYYRVARRFYRQAAKAGYKSPTSGKDMATVKAKEMDDLVKKGRGLGKGSDFDKSKNNPKENPNQKAVSPAVDKKPDNINSKKVASTTLTKADNDKIKSEFHKKMGVTDRGDWFVKKGYLKKVEGGGYNAVPGKDAKKGKREYDRAFNKFKLQYITDNFGTEVK